MNILCKALIFETVVVALIALLSYTHIRFEDGDVTERDIKQIKRNALILAYTFILFDVIVGGLTWIFEGMK